MGRAGINKETHRERRYGWLTIGTVFTVLVLVVYAMQLSVSVISDETVTMANAAWSIGKDWSLMIASLGGLYYRYIQALMTIPFFAWFQDNPAMIYRLSMVLQAVIQTSIVPVVYFICRRHLQVSSEKISVLLGMGACLVPATVLYTFYYRGDYLLGVLPWYVLLLLLEIMKAYDEKQSVRRIALTLLAAVVCIMAYMAHTRGIVVVIAMFMTALFGRIFLKRRSVYWPMIIAALVILAVIDSFSTKILKEALYSISGLNANAFESTDMGAYFNVFSIRALKDIIILCLSWMHTLIVTTQGLVLVGTCVIFVLLFRKILLKNVDVTSNEIMVIVFSFLIFVGYYAVGALFFKGVYQPLLTGETTKRVDRLMYDRYSICGASMMVFLALYALCCKRDWLKWRSKLLSIAGGVAFLGFFFWKVLPLAVKYTGYIYNTIILNTFQEVNDPSKIMSGEYYERGGLIAISLLGLGLMLAVLVFSEIHKKWMPYVVCLVVLISDLLLIHVNYVKIRKASNDYIVEATREVVGFMQKFEDDITDEYPYVLKGGLSGIKIQFYQSQLMDYKMFGKKQEETLDLDDYFIISDHDDINTKWYESDYYLFEDFDYENAQYDIVYVKGENLRQKLESLGYKMYEYNDLQ